LPTLSSVTPRPWQTKRLPAQRSDIAPDGSDVRVLLGVAAGGMAHFELGPGQTSIAVVHRTIEEIWYFLRGRGEMWRKSGEEEEIVEVGPGICLTIPVGTSFQFRSFGFEPLAAIGATMPPWPGEGEAVPTEGPWSPTVTAPPP
jgi:mannose-6-phosphate isomerase-like protein (cupin superfamily)